LLGVWGAAGGGSEGRGTFAKGVFDKKPDKQLADARSRNGPSRT